MAVKIEAEPHGEGCRIVRLMSTDRDITVPEQIDGRTVTSIGPSFLSGSPSSEGRTVTVPGCVTDIDSDAFCGVIGVRTIVYGGPMEMFCSFRIKAEYDCEVRTGDGHGFRFLNGLPMWFPGFDEAILGVSFRLDQDVAMARLRDPVLLTDEARSQYRRYLSGRIMPRAEQAVTTGDTAKLSELISTGMFSDDDIKRLMERSLRSGKTAVTSMLMSVLYARAHAED